MQQLVLQVEGWAAGQSPTTVKLLRITETLRPYVPQGTKRIGGVCEVIFTYLAEVARLFKSQF